jgi:hypothetical protein
MNRRLDLLELLSRTILEFCDRAKKQVRLTLNKRLELYRDRCHDLDLLSCRLVVLSLHGVTYMG